MKKIVIISTFVLFSNFIFAQGCSDAGICTINHAFQTDEKELKNIVEVATIFGAGETDVTYISPYISYTRKFNEKFAVTTKVTFSSANGNLGTSADFGDAFIIGNYTFKEKNNKKWSALAGWKIPFTNSNRKINDLSIPLEYQSSLGTLDLFLGTNLKYKKWDFNTTVQIPISNNNKNSYFKEFSNSSDFPTTNLFQRKSDALVRATYSIKTKNEKFTFKPNVLFIYHLGEDTYQNVFGNRKNIKGSDGLTINGNLITTYNFNKKNSLELSLATPFLIRDIRPDGLTRKFVAGLIYKISF
ncbi:MAG: hypothetical protein ACOYBS_07145 [Flavobacterium sp.]